MNKKIALCLGYFDCIHKGHEKLIRMCSEYAASHDMISAVYTFCEDKVGLFGPIYSFEDRQFLIRKAGADLIMSDIFSEELRNLSGKEFLDMLTSKMRIGAFFCGYDYTFGKSASCNAEFLSDYATHNNILCSIMPCFKADGERVSTSRIKSLLKSGEIEKANALLSEPYFIRGKVVHGRGVGRAFGIPTANITHSGFIPLEGVYAATVRLDDRTYSAVVNIGDKPTFGDGSITIEAMLIGYNGDLYGKELKLGFTKYLRPISKFESGEKLGEQIQKDIKEALCSE